MFVCYNNNLNCTGKTEKEIEGVKYTFRFVDGVLENLDEVKNVVDKLPVGSDLRLYYPECDWEKTEKGMIFCKKKLNSIQSESLSTDLQKNLEEKKEEPSIIEEEKKEDFNVFEEDKEKYEEELVEEVTEKILSDREEILKEARLEFENIFNKDVPNNKKNDLDRILDKIEDYKDK